MMYQRIVLHSLSAVVICTFGACADDPVADGNLSVDISIEAVSPSMVQASAYEEITIVGANLADEVSVEIGGVEPLGMVRHNEYRLTFVAPTLPVGTYDVVVANPNGQEARAEDALRYYAGQISFTEATVLVETDAYDFATGDVNGDGTPDIIAAEGESISTYVRSASGGHTRHELENDLYEWIAAVGDLDGDGRDDVMRESMVQFATVDGSLAAGVLLDPSGEQFPRALIADFTGDGENEVAAFLTNIPDERDAELRIFKVSPAGAVMVGEPRDVRIAGDGSIGFAGQALTADLNGDDVADLVYSADDELMHARLGPGFDAGTDFVFADVPAYGGTRHFALGDLNGDGIPDLVLAMADATSLHYGVGDGTFGEKQERTPMCHPREHVFGVALFGAGTEAADPSTARVAVECSTGVVRVWLWQNGEAIRSVPYEMTLPFPAGATTDMDLDGFHDLLYQNVGGVAVRFGASPESPALASYSGPVLASPGVDCWVQAVQGNFGGGREIAGRCRGRVSLLAGSEQGLRVARSLVLPGEGLGPLAVCDFDGDGDDDLLAQSVRPGGMQLNVLYVDGDAIQQGPVLDIPGIIDRTEHNNNVAGDLDGDGACDVFHIHIGGEVLAWLNQGGEFAPVEPVFPAGVNLHGGWIAGADLDGDGDLDLYDAVRGTIYRNDGAAHFTEVGRDDEVAAWRLAMLPMEFGNVDIWYIGPRWGGLQLGRVVRHADGSLEERSRVPIDLSLMGSFTWAIRFGDINGDQLIDAAFVPNFEPGQELATFEAMSDRSEIVVAFGAADGTIGAAKLIDLEHPSWLPKGPLSAFELLDVGGNGLDDLVFSGEWYNSKLVLVPNTSQ